MEMKHPYAAVEAGCDVDCKHFCKGRCPYKIETFMDVFKCPRVTAYAVEMYKDIARFPNPEELLQAAREAAAATEKAYSLVDHKELRKHRAFKNLIDEMYNAKVRAANILVDLEVCLQNCAKYREEDDLFGPEAFK